MDLIFLAFANNPDNPLSSLSREEEEVFDILSRRYVKKHFDLQRESHATLPKFAQHLIRFRDNLSVILYSGHAGRDQLLLEDQVANAKGIAQLLGQCPKLKLVILNGCSTEGQVKQLLELDNRPVVIATSAPINDRAATQFSISFFQAFSEQYSPLEEAFQIGLAAAQAATNESFQVVQDRGLAFLGKQDRPVWGIFPPEDGDEEMRWALPLGQLFTEGSKMDTPNQILIQVLMDSLEAFEPEVAQIKAEEKKRSSAIYFSEGFTSLKPKKQKVIIKNFPSPISSHLKTLFAPRRAGVSGEVFYDDFNLPRLQRLIQVYLSATELPNFFLLGQLWDQLLANPNLIVSDHLKNIIKRFLLSSSEERRTDIQFLLIPAIQNWLRENKLKAFFHGLESQSDNLNPGSAYYHACHTLESIRKRLERRHFRGPDDPQVGPTCLIAEEKVAEVLRLMSFLAHYTLVSIRNIDVMRNRQFLEPLFIHKVVRLEINLEYQDANPTLDIEDLDEYLHNYSILIRPKAAGRAASDFLNLTPFIFDENAFIRNTQVRKGNLKLFYFDHYDKANDTLFFKQVDNFASPLLRVGGNLASEPTPLQHLRAQIEAFTQLLFNQKLQTL